MAVQLAVAQTKVECAGVMMQMMMQKAPGGACSTPQSGGSTSSSIPFPPNFLDFFKV